MDGAAILFVIWVSVSTLGGADVQVFEAVEFSTMERCRAALAKVTATDEAEVERTTGPERLRAFCLPK